MKRRDFIKTSALLAAAAGSGELMKAAAMPAADSELADADQNPEEPEEPGEGPLLVSAPMLQNFADTSVGVAFAVSALANGYVLVSESPDMSGARKIKCGGYRLTEISDKVSQIRVTGLKPSTK